MLAPLRSSSRRISSALRLQRPGFELQLDLDLAARGVTAITGPSGSGKTTSLRLLAGLERGRGRLDAFGECWQDSARRLFVPAERRGIGYVFQEASLFSHLSVRGNLNYAARRRRGRSLGGDPEQIVELLKIGPLLERPAEALSGGERQRVAIARSLLSGPRLLVLDEPLAGLDDARKAEVLSSLESVRSDLGVPMLLVSHAIDEVARLADQVIAMDSGRVVATGAVETMLSRLDLPLAASERAGVVLEGTVGMHDDTEELTRLDVSGARLWTSRLARPLGSRVRVRVLARDVSLALSPPAGSSIRNVLDARVDELRECGTGQINVRLQLLDAEAPLLARVSKRSRDLLGLAPGMRVVAQVKSVSLMT